MIISSPACPKGVCPKSCDKAITSDKSSLSPSLLDKDLASCATSKV